MVRGGLAKEVTLRDSECCIPWEAVRDSRKEVYWEVVWN